MVQDEVRNSKTPNNAKQDQRNEGGLTRDMGCH